MTLCPSSSAVVSTELEEVQWLHTCIWLGPRKLKLAARMMPRVKPTDRAIPAFARVREEVNIAQ